MLGGGGLIALASGLIVRAIPELIAGRYPLGFDTVVDYLTGLSTVNYFGMSPARLLGGPNFYYLIQQGLYDITRNAFLVLKLLPVLLFGLFTLSIFFYSSRAAKLGERVSILAAVFASLSWLALRLSWDLERNVLGLTLAVFTLTILASDDRRTRFLSVPMTLLTVWAHPLVAVFLIGVEAMEVVYLYSRKGALALEMLIGVLAASIFLTYQLSSPVSSVDIPGLVSNLGFGSGATVGGLSYFLVLAWPSILLALGAVLARRYVRDRRLLMWVLFVIILGFVLPLVGFNLVFPYRIWLMMAFPLPILAAFGASVLPRPKALPASSVTAGLVLLLVLAVPFLSLQPQQAGLGSYLGLANYGPTAYQQNVVPTSETGKLLELLGETQHYLTNGSRLLLPAQFYGFEVYLEGPSTGVFDLGLVGSWYGQSLTQSFSQHRGNDPGIDYTIWWASDEGWYGETVPPPGFVAVASNGVFTLYGITRA